MNKQNPYKNEDKSREKDENLVKLRSKKSWVYKMA